MSDTLKQALSICFEGGGGEETPLGRVLPLVTLESDTRIAIDAEKRFYALPTDGRAPMRCEPGSGYMFYEVLESRRSHFEDQLCEAARKHSLPELDLLSAFPSVEIIRGVLEKNMAHTTRLALLWALPSELRDLRSDIIKASKAKHMPAAILELCERLVVPE